MVRECDIATALIYVAIYPDGGQRCFWYGALKLVRRVCPPYLLLLANTFPDSDINSTLPITPKTVQNFLGGKSMSLAVFHAICQTLNLDWEVIAGRKPFQETVQTNASDSGTASTTTISDNTVNQTIEQVGPGAFLGGVIGTVHQHN